MTPSSPQDPAHASGEPQRLCTVCGRFYPADHLFCAVDGQALSLVADAHKDPLVGRTLDDRWVIRRRLDGGNMGTVYEASQLSVDRRVAIKTLKSDHTDKPGLSERFFHEAKIASTISHPNVVTVFDFGQTRDGTLYLAMEYLEGQSLAGRLKQGPLSIGDILKVAAQICSALIAAHAMRIIHRDLKPANIYLVDMPDGSIFTKVLDFGIAKALDSDEKLTSAGEIFGTPWYMSPEQGLGRPLDGRSDLYALGCILYEMLTGRAPFEASTPLAILTAHINEPVKPIEEATKRRDIPPELSRLCMQLLEKSPNQRPPDASATKFALKSIQEAREAARMVTSTGIEASSVHLPSGGGAPAVIDVSSSQPAPTSARGMTPTAGQAQTSAAPAGHTQSSDDHLTNTMGGTFFGSDDYTYDAPNAPPASLPPPMPLFWALTLGLIGAIIATGTVATFWAWLSAGSPNFLTP